MGVEWLEKSPKDLIDIKHGSAFKGEFFRDKPHRDIARIPT
jgi:hypothetical protein